jgi:hypothetical protein
MKKEDTTLNDRIIIYNDIINSLEKVNNNENYNVSKELEMIYLTRGDEYFKHAKKLRSQELASSNFFNEAKEDYQKASKSNKKQG